MQTFLSDLANVGAQLQQEIPLSSVLTGQMMQLDLVLYLAARFAPGQPGFCTVLLLSLSSTVARCASLKPLCSNSWHGHQYLGSMYVQIWRHDPALL